MWRVVAAQQTDLRPVLRFPAGSGFDDVVPGGMRKRLRYAENRLLREGLDIGLAPATDADFDELFDGLVRLHRARWMARGEPGVMPPHLEDFHREAARRLHGRGSLRMHGLYLGEQLAAVFYGYHAGHRTIYYLSGFDPEMERFSPGNLVVARAIQYAISVDNARCFDFLRGAEDYKYAWGAVDEAVFSRSLRLKRSEVADAA
jgi:CelD/BcsL family acetyltransferase involved in cellulose biosynthesis